MKSSMRLFAAIAGFLFFALGTPACTNESATNTAEIEKQKGSLPEAPGLSVLEKLVGTWKNDDGKNYERWIRNADGSFLSVVFRLNGSDTIISEQANIYSRDRRWIFENKVKDQNSGQAVAFVAAGVTENNVQFSNPAHDFPTDISYTVDGTSLRAFIAGPNGKGGTDTIPFTYKKMQ